MGPSISGRTRSLKFSCLLYHGIGSQRRLGYLDLERFRLQIRSLLEAGYVIEGFDGILNRLSSGVWPSRYIVISFDDGHRSILDAIEFLNLTNCRASVFLATRACQTDPQYLNSGEIRRLAGSCHIGSHSVSHRRLDQLSSAEVSLELCDSKAWLEDLCDREIDCFSVPFGAVSNRIQQQALDAGYHLVGDSTKWWNRPATIDKCRRVHRVPIDYASSDKNLARIAAGNLSYFASRRGLSFALAWPKKLLFSRLMTPARKHLLSTWKRLR